MRAGAAALAVAGSALPATAAPPTPFIVAPSTGTLPPDAPIELAGCPLAGASVGLRAVVVVEAPPHVPAFTLRRGGRGGFELRCRRQRCCVNVTHGELEVELDGSEEWLGGDRTVRVDRSMIVRMTPRTVGRRTALTWLGLGLVGAGVGGVVWVASEEGSSTGEGSWAGGMLVAAALSLAANGATALILAQQGPVASIEPLRPSPSWDGDGAAADTPEPSGAELPRAPEFEAGPGERPTVAVELRAPADVWITVVPARTQQAERCRSPCRLYLERGPHRVELSAGQSTVSGSRTIDIERPAVYWLSPDSDTQQAVAIALTAVGVAALGTGAVLQATGTASRTEAPSGRSPSEMMLFVGGTGALLGSIFWVNTTVPDLEPP